MVQLLKELGKLAEAEAAPGIWWEAYFRELGAQVYDESCMWSFRVMLEHQGEMAYWECG